MSKKNCMSLLALFLCIFGFTEDFKFVAAEDTVVFYDDEKLRTFMDKRTIIPKGQELPLNCERNRIRLSNNNDKKQTVAFTTNHDLYDGWISIKNLRIKDCDQMLPDSIISIEEIGISKKFVPSYFLEVLKNKDASIIKKYDYQYYMYDYAEPYIGLGLQADWFYPVISNIGIRFHNSESFLFNKIEKIAEDKFRCTGYGAPGFTRVYTGKLLHSDPTWNSYFDSGKYESLILHIDGDYISIYSETSNEHLITYVKISDNLEEQLISLFEYRVCNLSEVTWPRDADGNSYYKEKIPIDKIMTVKENLRLRSGEETSSQVVTVMQAGTRVRIEEVGKAETIDGISSNWVKVNVQYGAKDRDGKRIPTGTVGWCFGGYLE